MCSICGLRGGSIFYRRGTKSRKQGMFLNHGNDGGYDFEEKIISALYPLLQGGPHNNLIAALAIALKQVKTPEYKVCIQQVKKNAKALPSALLRRECRLVTDGTDNHLLLWDLIKLGLIGTPAVTSRGCLEDDFATIADFFLGQLRLQALYRGFHAKIFSGVFRITNILLRSEIELRHLLPSLQFKDSIFDLNL